MSQKMKNDVTFEEFVNMGGEITANNPVISKLCAKNPMTFLAILEFHKSLGDKLFPEVTREEAEMLLHKSEEKATSSKDELEATGEILSLIADLLSL